MVVGSQDLTVRGCGITRLYLVTRRGNVGDRMLAVSPDFDRDVSVDASAGFGAPGPYRIQWSQDGQQVYFLVTDRGCIHVYRLDVVWRSMLQLTTQEAMTGFLALFPNGQSLLLAQAFSDHPWELSRLPLTAVGAGEPQRLTHLYDNWLAAIRWGKSEHLCYKGANGDEIDGWLLHPVRAREGVRYPLMVHIHGGPNGAYGVGMNPLYHYYAAQGYAVFYCNPHGSTGSGEAFMRAVLGDWGGQDFQDIMLGVDQCIARGIVDPERMVVTGYSYGGFMTMFIIGHTDRFKAAVPMAAVSNLVSFVGTSDLGFWLVTQAQGYPWDPERAAYYRERSPLTHAPDVTTPTMIVHPENDLRCPIEQSEQFYMTMKMIGKTPVELVRVPAAWHGGTTKPSFFRPEKALEWFGKYIEMRPEEYEGEGAL